MRTLWVLLLGLLAVGYGLTGCSNSDDSSTPPVTGTLSGYVVFHGQWPDSGNVQLSIFSNWNTTPCSWCGVAPGGPPAYYTPAFTRPLNPTGQDTIYYTITGITLGTYRSVAVGWRAPHVSDINCDEPTIGLWGADYHTTDSIPEAISFTNANPHVTANVHAFFEMLPIPGCDDRGRIEGTVRVPGTWPAEGLLVMLTTFPASAWMPVMQQPTGYFRMMTSADTVYRFTPPFGSYYLSLWTNAAPPAPVQWYGSYGLNLRAGDARPDAITLNASTPAQGGIVIPGSTPAPHWISGKVVFAGTRPAEGLLVLAATSPALPPQTQPAGYFAIPATDSIFALTGLATGTYYLSLWNNVQPPTPPTFYGAYGFNRAGNDTIPDGVVIGTEAATWGANAINILGPQ
jgi:hypothetical protein